MICDRRTTHLTKSSLFWVIFRAHRHSHLNSAPVPTVESETGTLPSLAWGRSAQLQDSISQVLLPDHNTVSPKPSFTVGSFPGWKKCLPARHKSQSVGVFHCPVPSPDETAALSHPTKLHQLAAKKIAQETHERYSLVTRELVTPEGSWCPEKSVSFISSSEQQAEECLSRRGIVKTGC